MTMPGARRLNVDGQDYQYKIKGTKGRRSGETGKTLRCIIQTGPKEFMAFEFESKLWTPDHEADVEAPLHKNAFALAEVGAIIRAIRFNQGKRPDSIHLANWKLCQPKSSTQSSGPGSVGPA